MLKIRLSRCGKINSPDYSIILCDSRVAAKGKFIEKLGKYNPKAKPLVFTANKERIDHWVKKGAQLSDRMIALLKKTS